MKAECPYCNQGLIPTKPIARFFKWFKVAFGICINPNCDAYNNWFARTKDGDVYSIPSCENIKLRPFKIKEFTNMKQAHRP